MNRGFVDAGLGGGTAGSWQDRGHLPV